MSPITNAGGSLSSALALTAIAWAVRWWREEMNRRKAEKAALAKPPRALPKFHAFLSRTALRLLVEAGTVPFIIFDVRSDASEPLPTELRGSIRLSLAEVESVLSKPEHWAESCGEARPPSRSDVLIFLGSTVEEANEGAAAAGGAGYLRTLTLQPLEPDEAHDHLADLHQPADFTFISPNALATLLGYGSAAPSPLTGGALVIDVRRQDERLLYGAIHGSHSVPAEEFPSALSLPPQHFMRRYGFPKPLQAETIIVASRAHSRAVWAALLASEAGYSRVLVLSGGHCAWVYDPDVKAYAAYAAGEPPPEPEEENQQPELRFPDHDEGLAELGQLDLIL